MSVTPFLRATVQEFIEAYDDIEAMLLEDPEGEYLLDEDIKEMSLKSNRRIQLALDDAEGMILSHYIKALPMGRAMIQQSFRRLQLRIARYLLDTVKGRQSVKEDYESCLEFLKSASEMTDNIQLTQEEQDVLGINVKQSRRIYSRRNPRVFTRDSLSSYRSGDLFYR